VSFCVNAYCIVRFGDKLRETLREVVRESLSETSLGAVHNQSDGHNFDRHFMSVFAQSEDSWLPSGMVAKQTVDKATDTSIQRLLEASLSLGYVTAAIDNCHLLYASWNALGKCDLWNDVANKIREFKALPNDPSTVILELRDEMCLAQYKMKRLHGELDLSTTLVRARDEKLRAHRASKVELGNLLREMIKKASHMVEEILQKFVHTEEFVVPPAVFCLLEACCVYISMAISMFTRPSSDFFSTTMLELASQSKGRTRGYSTDSEGLHSEGGSVDSRGALVDTVERLQEVCDFLGAAPAHPDWLDKNCRLMDYITHTEAADVASEAMLCMTKLVAVGLKQSKAVSRSAIMQLSASKEAEMATTISALFEVTKLEAGGSSLAHAERRDYTADIGEVGELDLEFVRALTTGAASSTRQRIVSVWCPHSAQRILGKLQDAFRARLVSDVSSPELRASGEWEVLLARALSSSAMSLCTDAFVCESDTKVRLVQSEQWLQISRGALDATVSAAALFRLGVTKTGRITHPLSSVEASTDSFDMDKTSIVEDLTDNNAVSEAVQRKALLLLAVIAHCPASATCDSIATQLLVDVASFTDLQGLVAVAKALRALETLRIVVDTRKGSCSKPALSLVQRTAAVLETYGTGGRSRNSPDSLYRLFACLSRDRSAKALCFDTIVSRDVDPFAVLTSPSSIGCSFQDEWDWDGSHRRNTICSMFYFVWHECTRTDSTTRAFFARALSTLIAREFDSPYQNSHESDALSPILRVLNELPDENITFLVENDICGLNSSKDESAAAQTGFQDSLCILFALVASHDGSSVFQRSGLILEILERSYDKWKSCDLRDRKSIVYVTMLYATLHRKLHIFGSRMFDDLKAKHRSKVDDLMVGENMTIFADFVRNLSCALSSSHRVSGGQSPGQFLPSSCSYAIKNDYLEQHWYNCFTCGLTDDKGCCSLCAIVCHQGHDVAYARHSSFFCDCGSVDDASSATKCKCLSQNARDDFLRQADDVAYTAPLVTRPVLSSHFCSLIVKTSFAQTGMSALIELKEKGQTDGWIRFLFECTKREFDNWISFKEEVSASLSVQNQSIGSEHLHQKLASSTVTWKPQELKSEAYMFLGASRSGVFSMRMSSHRTTDRKGLSRHGIGRSAIDADGRGRIAIAESSDISFCTCLPFASTVPSDNEVKMSLSRSAMTSAIGNISVGFRVVGLKFSRECENLVLAWSSKEAMVIHMKSGLTAADRTVSLELDLASDDDSSHIVTCFWLEGSGTGLVVGCSRRIFIFNVSNLKGSTAPIANISLATCPNSMRDVTAVLAASADTGEEAQGNWNFFVLLENGVVEEVSLSCNQDGEMRFADPEQEKVLRSSKANELISTVFGGSSFEVVSLSYLVQSCVLLCETRASGTVAVLLNAKSDVLHAFKFLPYRLESSLFDEHGATGPFTNWRELGVVSREAAVYYRLSFVGLNTAGDPILLYLEFNESGTYIQEFPKNPGCWFDSLESYEGFAVFTTPQVSEDFDPLNYTGNKLLLERVVLCAISLNGSLQMYGEAVSAPSRAALEPVGHVLSTTSRTKDLPFDDGSLQKSLQLLSMEKLQNVTHSQKLVFCANGLGR
jgi:Putative zinc finger in N-recognin (UBR box)